MSTALVFLLTLALVSSSPAEESHSPEQRLRPRNFNPHPYDGQTLLDKYYKHLNDAEPTQQGPVLFPNDAPPPPKPPLIVTSRPLGESISRSELTPTTSPINNSLAQSSYLNRVRILRPNYAPLNFYNKPDLYNHETTLPSYQDPNYQYKSIGQDLVQYKSIDNNIDPYKPIDVPSYNQINIPQYKNVALYKSPQSNYGPINFYKKPLIPVDTNVGRYSVDDTNDYNSYDEGKTTLRHPYASLLKKSRLLGNEDEHRYNDYEEQTILPPIYKALSDYAQQKVLRTPSKPSTPIRAPQQPAYKKAKSSNNDYQDYSNEVENESDYGKKYAFSYSVKDHKTGDDFSHSQHSSGSATNGEYRVRLPDGRMQIVSYTADEGGYKADVRYAEDDVKPLHNTIDNHSSNINQATYPKNTIRYSNDDVKPLHNIIDNQQFKINQGTYPKNNYNQGYYNKYDSKEYFNDNYEYGNKISENENQRSYTPAPSKFGPIVVPNNDYSSNSYKVTASGVTATPQYDGTILITPTKKPYFLLQSTPNFITRVPVEINVPSTTPLPNFSYGLENTERVVHIGSSTKSPLLYTSIRNRLSHSDFSLVPVTPTGSSYVSSTLSPLNTGSEQKSKLGNFVSRFSKYLSFNN